ncbi:unnamed protein product [Camellia sinensis]
MCYGRLLCSATELQSRPKLPTGATKSVAARGFQCYIVAHVKNGPAAEKTPIGYQAGRHYATAGSATTIAATGIHAITNPQSSVASFNSVAENATTAATVSAVYTTSAASPHTAIVATAAIAAAAATAAATDAVETTTSTTGYTTYTHTIAYWRKFVAEYYSPRAKKRWCLSLYDNVGHHSLGVYPQATMRLEKLGPLEWDKVVHGHEAWRLITCIWLHAGILGLNSQQSNMLGSNSQLREMMQNPEFIRQLTFPETMQEFHGNPREGAFIDEKQLMTLQQTLLSQLGRQPSTQEAVELIIYDSTLSCHIYIKELQKSLEDCWCGTLDNMGLEMLMNMFGGLGIGSPAVPVRSDAPGRTVCHSALTATRMGFFDTRENIQALIAIAGNVHAAVERLLGNPVLAEVAKAQFSRNYSDNLALVRAYEA